MRTRTPGPASEVDRLHAALDSAYRELAAVRRELAVEQEMTRRLRLVVALAPYNAVRRPNYRRRPAQGG